ARSRWSFAEPEWNSRRLAMRVFHADSAGFDSQNFPRCIAELKNITRHTFHREIFVDRADESFRGIKNHAIICVIGNCASIGQSSDSRAASATNAMIDSVVM